MPWITSLHAIEASIKRNITAVLYICEENSRTGELKRIARGAGLTVRTVPVKWLRSRVGSSLRGAALEIRNTNENDQQVVLGDWLSRTEPGSTGPILALDHITDPHNVGAILRSAYLFGVALVILPARRSALAGEGMLRSSAGASRSVALAIVPNLVAALRACRDAGWWIYTADAGGTPLPEARFDRATVIVLGAEGKGITPAVRRTSDLVVTIPDRAPHGSTVDSFNVSVAAGIILYEWARNR